MSSHLLEHTRSGRQLITQIQAAVNEHLAGRGRLRPDVLNRAVDQLALTTEAVLISAEADAARRAVLARRERAFEPFEPAPAPAPEAAEADAEAERERRKRIIGGVRPYWLQPPAYWQA